ncbi:MAG: DUF4340 domain-containing protein [Chitinispirillaceae bacterium]|nr:DUF4340 domain-containing protein [Chitinispirillaceae bacterium]
MKEKKIIYLLAILAVIVAVIVIGNQLGKKTPSEKELTFFPGLTEQAVGSITIREGSNAIKVRRKGDVWVVSKPSASTDAKTADAAASPLVSDSVSIDAVEGEKKAASPEYPVDSASIASALEKITALKKDALISENPEKQDIFEVDSSKGLLVEMADNSGKPIGSVIIGKSGADWNSNYVRCKGSNSVYMASGGVRNSFFTDLNRWRNKSILKFDKATAKGLTLAKKDSGMITLAHADSGNPWQIIEPIDSPAKTEEVEGILDKLALLNATDFQDEALPDTAMGFDKPELVVTVSFKNGSSRNVIFGKKNSDNKYWVKTDGKDQIFLIADYTANQINKKLDDLKGEPLVKPIDPDTLNKK